MQVAWRSSRYIYMEGARREFYTHARRELLLLLECGDKEIKGVGFMLLPGFFRPICFLYLSILFFAKYEILRGSRFSYKAFLALQYTSVRIIYQRREILFSKWPMSVDNSLCRIDFFQIYIFDLVSTTMESLAV